MFSCIICFPQIHQAKQPQNTSAVKMPLAPFVSHWVWRAPPEFKRKRRHTPHPTSPTTAGRPCVSSPLAFDVRVLDISFPHLARKSQELPWLLVHCGWFQPFSFYGEEITGHLLNWFHLSNLDFFFRSWPLIAWLILRTQKHPLPSYRFIHPSIVGGSGSQLLGFIAHLQTHSDHTHRFLSCIRIRRNASESTGAGARCFEPIVRNGVVGPITSKVITPGKAMHFSAIYRGAITPFVTNWGPTLCPI